jgi:hypothetical protein
MLRNLLLRDWILNRRSLLSMLGIFTVFQVYFVMRVSSARTWLVFAAIYAAFLAVAPYGRDDKFRTTAWACTLPVSRRDLVKARCVGGWLFVAAAMAIAFALALLVPGSQVAPGELFQPATLLLGASVITLIAALMLPFTVRFGIKGVIILVVAFQILGSAVLLVLMATGGRSGGSGGNPVRRTIHGISEGLAHLQALVSPPVFYAGLAVTLIALTWLSYRFAAALFQRREL